jgi:D-alanyl-D-alanine carboxypeptidase (penicillin-binding protein 5/6)
MTPAVSPDDLAEFSAMFRGAGSGQAAHDPLDPERLAAARRRRRRRRFTGAVVTLAILAVIGSYIPITLLAPAGAAASTTTPVVVTKPAAAALVLPAAGASAVSITGAADFEKLTGASEIHASGGEAGPLPMASISKLITTLVVLEAKPLALGDAGPTITFSKADSDLYDKYYVLQATVQPMKTGSAMSEHDVLETMLVVSASNYAEAVTNWAFGSQARYLSAVKAWLAKHGFSSTKLVEPTGIDPRNVSTPADLIAIGKLALANPVVAAIVQTQTLTVPSLGQWPNNNQLLGTDGVTGIKTGTLDGSGACLLFSAVINIDGLSQITVVGAILGGQDHGTVDGDVRKLLASIKAGFHKVPLIAKGTTLGSYTTPWKDDAGIVAASSASVLTWSDAPITSTVKIEPVTTGPSGKKVGSVTFVAGKSTVSVPLVLKGAIAGPGWSWRLTHPGELFGK